MVFAVNLKDNDTDDWLFPIEKNRFKALHNGADKKKLSNQAYHQIESIKIPLLGLTVKNCRFLSFNLGS